MSYPVRFRTPLAAYLALALVIVLALPAVAFAAEGNGAFTVQVHDGTAWKDAGILGFGLQYTTETLVLPAGTDRVRLVQSGGTAAQIDAVTLDGLAPHSASGSDDALVVRKLGADDNDVTDAYGRTLELTFAGAGTSLTLDARVQGSLAGYLPFEYPQENLGKPVDASSAFFSLAAGKLPAELDTAAAPYLKAFTEPSSGHPAGYTYVWLANDGANLRAIVDFTPDNTADDGEDYASMNVRTTSGVRTFTISTADNTWGEVAFTYTDTVGYQHKLYAFEIPWAEIGGTPETLDVSFTAYGTASYIPVALPVHRFYRAASGTHFYTADALEKANIEAHPAWGYTYDGVAWVVDATHPFHGDALHRFYNAASRTHFYTANAAEKAMVEAHPELGYAYEGVAYNVSFTDDVLMPVYRFRHKLNGTHFYTASDAEKDAVSNSLGNAYQLEGVGFYFQPFITFS